MYEDAKTARRNDNLESALKIHHLTKEKNKLDATYDKSELVADMKGQMAKKDADHQKLQEKYELLVNLTRAQATVIQNLKFKYMKEKELLTHEKLELKLQVADLLKGNEKLSEERVQLKLHVVELIKGEEEQKQKIKGIQAMLEE
ncbi:hypothetical protein VPH35_135577 [Triticum aestivum]